MELELCFKVTQNTFTFSPFALWLMVDLNTRPALLSPVPAVEINIWHWTSLLPPAGHTTHQQRTMRPPGQNWNTATTIPPTQTPIPYPQILRENIRKAPSLWPLLLRSSINRKFKIIFYIFSIYSLHLTGYIGAVLCIHSSNVVIYFEGRMPIIK